MILPILPKMKDT